MTAVNFMQLVKDKIARGEYGPDVVNPIPDKAYIDVFGGMGTGGYCSFVRFVSDSHSHMIVHHLGLPDCDYEIESWQLRELKPEEQACFSQS